MGNSTDRNGPDKSNSGSIQRGNQFSPSLSIGETESETNFFKVLTENLKYGFDSPVPTTTQFPTPYSNNNNMNQNNLNANYLQSQNTNDSSIVENSMLQKSTNNHIQFSSAESILNSFPSGNNNNLNDFNMQPSSVLQFNSNNSDTNSNNNTNDNGHNNPTNNFTSEFLLPSPEQLKEFLLDSPAGFNFFHKTPAKTPLKFITEQELSSTSSNLVHLFTATGNISNDSTNNDLDTKTPLKKFDINLMYQLSNSLSPSKRLSMSLTPYGRRILNDMGTPFNSSKLHNGNALVDFQKAKKNIEQSSPENLLRFTKNTILTKTPNKKLKTKMINDNDNIQNNYKKDTPAKKTSYKSNELNDDIVYGSSPTTIQLNSSVTKSVSKLDAKIPNLTVENNLLRRLPLSPTPKSNISLISEGLTVPELPKMGSFKSERTLSISSNLSMPNTIKTVKPKKNKAKQPKFQVFVSSIHKFNESVPVKSKRETAVLLNEATKKNALKRSKSLNTSNTQKKKKQKNTLSKGKKIQDQENQDPNIFFSSQ
ncbi:hypothetical protein KAFR_0C04900 [Kazachstania africana CBS 2517]|uniref:Ndd1p n=1 Tax=Kazachstania africana (strain ATCC 22294 / BCRC 22015 / CBS 2517 / CECT 1963 / NBRC 1671 / NRRL Y-8276) TaxID=1071382 RepID=H2ASY1_KAZAF|nr:hypothetical protein KAFR_0C04900 [Kazachstania africana CBS 2517]CCF57481.1 hypothetical protein KAFR_0C04900 [Kazachstania africana CBS 2517]